MGTGGEQFDSNIGLRDVLAAHGLRDVQIRCDLTGRDRIAVAYAQLC
jgi:hypothetical protein